MPTQNLMAVNSALPQVLVAQHLAAIETDYYVVGSNTSVQVGKATLTNTSASSVTVSVSLVKSGDGAGNSNRVVSDYVLVADDSTELFEVTDAFLGPGDKISAIASAGSAVAFVVSGVVFS